MYLMYLKLNTSSYRNNCLWKINEDLQTTLQVQGLVHQRLQRG